MLFEIRDYTIEKEWFNDYVLWAKTYFLPFAKKRINVVGFWADLVIPAEIDGLNPIITVNGQPNVTWIARYKNKKERDEFYTNLKSDNEWAEVWGKHPKQNSYIHENSRFFESLT